MTPTDEPLPLSPLLRLDDGAELEYPLRLVPPRSQLAQTPFALWVIGALRPRLLVQLGIHTGNSYCAFLQGVRAQKLGTRCFGVDPGLGSESGDGGARVDLRAYHDTLYGTFSTLLPCAFNDALRRFSPGTVDLLHLDGPQSDETLATDFARWLPRMSTRGVVLLHATNRRDGQCRVWRFWEQLVQRYPTFELTHAHGLGIAHVGSEPLISPLGALFTLKTDADVNRVREYFARLGNSVVDRLSLAELNTEVDALQAKVGVLQATMRTVRQEARQGAERLQAVVAEHEGKLRAATLHAQSQTALLRQRILMTTELQRELLLARRQQEQVYSSKSWRLTAPIRYAVGMIRRLLGAGRST